MPELPEVETVVTALNRALCGRRVRGAKFIGNVRLPFDARKTARLVAGKTILGVRRRAKYIIIDLEDGAALLAHLGMTGFFHVEPSGAPLEKHDRLTFSLDGDEELRYADARRFGFVVPTRIDDATGFPVELSRLGPEPLDRRFTGKTMLAGSRGRKTPVKVFVMDQSVVVGVGNIYASEALHAAGVDPRRPAGELTPEEWNRVVREIKAVLRSAIRKGGSTIKNYRTVDGSEGGFQRVLRVYGRSGEVCARCGAEIAAIRQCGRSTFFCRECQR